MGVLCGFALDTAMTKDVSVSVCDSPAITNNTNHLISSLLPLIHLTKLICCTWELDLTGWFLVEIDKAVDINSLDAFSGTLVNPLDCSSVLYYKGNELKT